MGLTARLAGSGLRAIPMIEPGGGCIDSLIAQTPRRHNTHHPHLKLNNNNLSKNKLAAIYDILDGSIRYIPE